MTQNKRMGRVAFLPPARRAGRARWRVETEIDNVVRDDKDPTLITSYNIRGISVVPVTGKEWKVGVELKAPSIRVSVVAAALTEDEDFRGLDWCSKEWKRHKWYYKTEVSRLVGWLRCHYCGALKRPLLATKRPKREVGK